MKTGPSRPSKRDPTDGLNHNERIFCYQFLLTGKQGEAAKVAWSCKRKKDADLKGWAVMKRPRVINFIAQLRKESLGSRESVLEESKKVIAENKILAYSDPKDYVDVLNFPADVQEKIKNMGPASRAMSKIKLRITENEGIKTTDVEVEFHSKPAALNALAKCYQLYEDMSHHGEDIIAPIIYQLPDNGMGAKRPKEKHE